MNKEKALEEFFRSLKLMLKTASIYPQGHPALRASAENIKAKIDSLLASTSPLKVSFSPRSILVDGQYLEKEKLYEELALFFHAHRIKDVEIRDGVTVEELANLFTLVDLPVRQVFWRGGFRKILEEENISHVSIHELDYSQLLLGEGEEIKEIWPYLLEEAVDLTDARKIIQLADHFEKVIGHLRIGELLEKKEFNLSFEKFFTLLKSMDEEKFRECSKQLLTAIVRNREIIKETNLKQLRKILKGLSEKEMTSALLEEILSDEHFDLLSFQVFSEVSKRRTKKIADSLQTQIRKEGLFTRFPKVKQKIKKLLTGSTAEVISEVYRQTLSALIADMPSEGTISLDKNRLQKNYQFLLLSLLDEEQKEKRLVEILEKILDEWENIVQERKLEYLQYLVQILEKRRKELSSEPVLKLANLRLLNFIIDAASAEENGDAHLEEFIDYLKGSFISSKAFLSKIFDEHKLNPAIMKFFFRLHPDSVPLFNKRLAEKLSDREFLMRVIGSLEKMNRPESQQILSFILFYGDEFLKAEALKAMGSVSVHDGNSLLKILDEESEPLRKEALKLLASKEETKERTLEMLFSISSPFGIRNKVLLKNIRMVEELDLKEARECLMALTQKKFFWNKKIKDEALKVLEKWDARNH